MILVCDGKGITIIAKGQKLLKAFGFQFTDQGTQIDFTDGLGIAGPEVYFPGKKENIGLFVVGAQIHKAMPGMYFRLDMFQHGQDRTVYSGIRNPALRGQNAAVCRYKIQIAQESTVKGRIIENIIHEICVLQGCLAQCVLGVASVEEDTGVLDKLLQVLIQHGGGGGQ